MAPETPLIYTLGHQLPSTVSTTNLAFVLFIFKGDGFSFQVRKGKDSLSNPGLRNVSV